MRSFQAHLDENRLTSTGQSRPDKNFNATIILDSLGNGHGTHESNVFDARSGSEGFISLGEVLFKYEGSKKGKKNKLHVWKRSRWEPFLIQHQQMSTEKRQNMCGTTKLQCGHFKLLLTKIDWYPLDKVVRSRFFYFRIIRVSLGIGHGHRALNKRVCYAFDTVRHTLWQNFQRWNTHVLSRSFREIMAVQSLGPFFIHFAKCLKLQFYWSY